jgi:uncharacterized membrane protein
MTKIRFSIVFLCLITFLSPIIYSAFLTGTIYDEGINPVKGATVSLERGQTLYSQMITNQSGEYLFSLPSGEYQIIASMKKGNQTLQTSAILNLSESDNIRIDLILMQELGIKIPEIVTIEEEKPFVSPAEEPSINWVTIGFVFFLIIVAIVLIYFVWKRQAEGIKKEIEEIKKKREEPPLGRFLTDEEKIYQLVQRMKEVPQKHIVIETGFSKAKVTLILKKLEKMGKIKRTSTGREKIIKPVE